MNTRIALVMATVLTANAAAAQPEERPLSEGGTISITFENDVFGGTDKDYTHGGRIDYVTPRNELPFWAKPVRSALKPVFGNADWYATYAIGQNIYTPNDITRRNPPPDDRPYAGFLYGSIGLAADSGDELDTVALDIGVIGDGSLGEQTQKLVHKLIGSPRPEGWDTQLGDYPGFRLLYEKKYRYGSTFDLGLFSLQGDIAPHFNLALGNVDTSAGAGVTLRIGDRLVNDYGPPRVRPAVSGPGFFAPSDRFGWTLFTALEARAIGHNGFIEGGLFTESRGARPNRIVGDIQAGLSLQIGNAELTYTHVIRSPEVVGRDRFSIFGSLNLRTKF